MQKPHDIEVLILGAGPAGLVMGRELSRRAIPYLILEKEQMVGSTFVRMTDSTTFGPWLNNTLPGAPVSLAQKLARTTRADYARYLQEYAAGNELRILFGVKVQAVHEEQGRFLVSCEHGESYRAQYLINATGIFSKPNLPQYEGECAIPSIHSAAYRWPYTVEELTGKKWARVLIVGSRLSAGEILEELYEAGHELQLSHREPISTWPSPLEEALLSPLSYVWEEISLRLGLQRPSNLRPKLRRGRQWSLLTSGKVRTRPDIARLAGDSVVFRDGQTARYDLIIYATGYRPALDHLAPLLGSSTPWLSGLETVEIPNLFFLGLPGSRSFRSEFLRGIREDAPYLANLLAARRTPPVRASRSGPRTLPGPAPLAPPSWTGDRASEPQEDLPRA